MVELYQSKYFHLKIILNALITQRFFCDLNQNTTLNYERQGNSKKTDRSFDFATSVNF